MYVLVYIYVYAYTRAASRRRAAPVYMYTITVAYVCMLSNIFRISAMFDLPQIHINNSSLFFAEGIKYDVIAEDHQRRIRPACWRLARSEQYGEIYV